MVLAPTRSLTFTTSGKLSRAAVKADYLSGAIRDMTAVPAERRRCCGSSSLSRADPRPVAAHAVLIAVTGGTGFVGRHVVAALRQDGHTVRAMARRDAPELAALGATLIQGALDGGDGIERLVDGADAVVHVAGVIQAPDRDTFEAINAGGSARVAAAMAARPGRAAAGLLVAAREPAVSDYAASKAMASSWRLPMPTGWT